MTRHEWRYRIYPIIPAPDGTEVLAQSGIGGLVLPCLQLPDPASSFTSQVNALVKAAFGLEVTVLRCISITPDIRERRSDVIVAMESHSARGNPPSGTVWLERCSLDRIDVTPEQKAAILSALEPETETPDPAAPPWQERGWLNRVVNWLAGELGSPVLEPASLVQLAASPAHYLLRVDTGSGRFFFKALGPILAHEYNPTLGMSTAYPDHSPVVVASSDPDSWLLMEDVGGETLDQTQDVSCWEDCVRNFSRIQADFVRKAELLTEWGCSDWGLNRLPAAIDEFFGFFSGVASRVDGASDKDADVESLAKNLESRCVRLASLGIPSTLGHGDLNLSNILTKRGRCVFLDWAEGYFGHPLFSFDDFVASAESKHPDMKKLREQLSNAYLEPWSQHMPMRSLKEALRLSEPLAVLRYAVSGLRQRGEPASLSQESAVLLFDHLKGLVNHMRTRALADAAEA
jgi:hypothetical protein